MLQLDLQDLGIPARLLGEPVVGEDVGALLRVVEVVEAHARHGHKPEFPGRRDAAVAGDDAAVLVDEHGVVEPERCDARRDLGDLPVAMRAGVAVVGLEAAHGQRRDGELVHARRHSLGWRGAATRANAVTPAAATSGLHELSFSGVLRPPALAATRRIAEAKRRGLKLSGRVQPRNPSPSGDGCPRQVFAPPPAC